MKDYRCARNIAGPRIREARLAEKPPVTMEDLHSRLQVLDVELSVASIGRMELGEQAITDIQLEAFAKALKVSAAWLLGDTDNKSPF